MKTPGKGSFKVMVNAVALAACFFILAAVIWVMYHYTQPGPVDQARRAERRKNLAELSATNAVILENYAWLDQGKGLVRLPVSRAMEIAAQEGQNPAEAKARLIARMEKATPVPTPTAPPVGTNEPVNLPKK